MAVFLNFDFSKKAESVKFPDSSFMLIG